jgi:hypothetical protein
MLERSHNNIFAVEVWERFAAPCDTLVGVAKLPLNKFFIAYRDPVVATQLLSSKVSFDIPPVDKPLTFSWCQIQQ